MGARAGPALPHMPPQIAFTGPLVDLASTADQHIAHAAGSISTLFSAGQASLRSSAARGKQRILAEMEELASDGRLARARPSRVRRQAQSPLPAFEIAVKRHISEVGASALSPSTEAYATMWYGNTTSGSFDGLVALVDSVFAMDSQRSMVIMTPVERSRVHEPETDTGLLRLQRAYPRVIYERVPLRTIFNNVSKVCQSLLRCGGQGARSYMYTYSKFGLWSLTRWSRLMYLDIDLLVTHPLEQIWATQIGTTGALVAASRAIRARTFKGLAETQCGQTRGKTSIPFNTGLILLQPSKIIADAIVFEMDRHWRYSFKSPCRSDQTYFNILLASHHVKCLPYSTNCRDPQFLNHSTPPQPHAPVTLLSRCLEPMLDDQQSSSSTAKIAAPMAVPFAVHFACHSKPWLPTNRHLFFARHWQRHLATAKDKMMRR